MEPLTVALVTAVLSGMAGTNASALMLIHAPEPSIVWVEGAALQFGANQTRTVPILIPLGEGSDTVPIRIVTEGVTHELTVKTVGEIEPPLHWWLPLCALPLALLSVRVRRVAGNS